MPWADGALAVEPTYTEFQLPVEGWADEAGPAPNTPRRFSIARSSTSVIPGMAAGTMIEGNSVVLDSLKTNEAIPDAKTPPPPEAV